MREIFDNQHINKVTPHFTFMRRAQNADTHALNSVRCPKIVPPSAPVLSHLTCILSMKVKNGRKTLIFTQPKMSRYKQHLFAIFRRILITRTLTYLLYSDHTTCRRPSRKWKSSLSMHSRRATLMGVNFSSKVTLLSREVGRHRRV